MNLAVIIAAGGEGTRMKADSSKQFLELAGISVVARSVALFDRMETVEEIVIAIDPGDVLRCRLEVVDRHGFSKVKAVVAGGESRALSVKNALNALSVEIDTVAVHDGARPLFPPELLGGGLDEIEKGGCQGVVFGLPVKDTIKETDSVTGLVTSTPERSRLWAAQTPQIFSRQALEKAYGARREILKTAPDDAFLVELAGGKVKMLPGSPENIKLTEPLDLVIAGEILKRRETGERPPE